MNEKRIFGTVLTILGIIALGYFVLQLIKQSKDSCFRADFFNYRYWSIKKKAR